MSDCLFFAAAEMILECMLRLLCRGGKQKSRVNQ